MDNTSVVSLFLIVFFATFFSQLAIAFMGMVVEFYRIRKTKKLQSKVREQTMKFLKDMEKYNNSYDKNDDKPKDK